MVTRCKSIKLITLFLILGLTSFSQKLKIGIETGIACFMMSELEDLNSKIIKSLPFEAETTNNYPPYIYFKPSFLLEINKYNIGLKIAFSSTGSRVSSKDYSGEFLFDTKLKYVAPSIYGDFAITPSADKLYFYFTTELGLIKSNLDQHVTLIVNEQLISESSGTFNSSNYFIEPGVRFDYLIHPKVKIGINTSLLIQFGDDDFMGDNGETINYGQGTIGPDWSGLRAGVAIYLLIP